MYSFEKAARDWQELVADPAVEAIVIASPQDTHRAIAGVLPPMKSPFCVKSPLLSKRIRAAWAAAQRAGVVNVIGFNYIRTPASQFARRLIQEGEIGDIVVFRDA